MKANKAIYIVLGITVCLVLGCNDEQIFWNILSEEPLDDKSILNVKDFGAKGDGISDDTKAIQNTIDALPPNGGPVLIPAGVYVISGTLNMPDKPVHLIGAGLGVQPKGTVIKLAAGANCDIIQYNADSHVYFGSIRDIEIYGSKSAQSSGHGIHFVKNISDVTIENVYIQDVKGDAIKVAPATAAIWNIWINKCLMENSGEYGLYLLANTNTLGLIKITDSYFWGNLEGIRIEGQGTGRVIISSSTIIKSRQHGVHLKSAKAINIVNCQIHDNSHANDNTYDGIYVNDDLLNASVDIIISSNLIGNWNTSSQRYGINLQGLTDYVLILGNNFRGNATGAINIPVGVNANGKIADNIQIDC